MEAQSTDASHSPPAGPWSVTRTVVLALPAQAQQGLPRTHSCRFCPNRFSSSHALGGHQNAHTHDGNGEQQRPRISDAVMRYYRYNPFDASSSSVARSDPRYGFSNRLSGTGMYPRLAIHAPYYQPRYSSTRYSYATWGEPTGRFDMTSQNQVDLALRLGQPRTVFQSGESSGSATSEDNIPSEPAQFEYNPMEPEAEAEAEPEPIEEVPELDLTLRL